MSKKAKSKIDIPDVDDVGDINDSSVDESVMPDVPKSHILFTCPQFPQATVCVECEKYGLQDGQKVMVTPSRHVQFLNGQAIVPADDKVALAALRRKPALYREIK